MASGILNKQELVHEAALDEGDESRVLGALALAFFFASAAVLAAEFTGSALFDRPADEETNLVLESLPRACIAQYAPGERFKKPEVCASGTYDVPASVLSYPLVSQ